MTIFQLKQLATAHDGAPKGCAGTTMRQIIVDAVIHSPASSAAHRRVALIVIASLVATGTGSRRVGLRAGLVIMPTVSAIYNLGRYAGEVGAAAVRSFGSMVIARLTPFIVEMPLAHVMVDCSPALDYAVVGTC